MQNTEEKLKSRFLIRVLKYISFSLLAVVILLISFGGSIGVPQWNDIFVFCGIYADTDSMLSLSFINVGSADACFIKSNGKSVLIDCGKNFDYDKISAYLIRNNCKHLDAIIISHTDNDHIGSASDVIKDFGTDALYMYPDSNKAVKSVEYKSLCKSIKEYNVNVINPTVKSTVNIGDMSFSFISPQKEYSTTNDNSLVVRLTCKGKSVLFTGDISKKVEEDLVNSDTELKCDVLKVAHHASKYSSSENFLKKVKPEISVVSVGSNEISIPDYTTLNNLQRYSRKVYKTSTDKTIVINSDGKNLSVKTHA